MGNPDHDFDAQDQAEIYDETHIDDEGDGELSLDEADDVLDVTQAEGDGDEEPFDEDDQDLDQALALDGIEAEADALLGLDAQPPSVECSNFFKIFYLFIGNGKFYIVIIL